MFKSSVLEIYLENMERHRQAFYSEEDLKMNRFYLRMILILTILVSLYLHRLLYDHSLKPDDIFQGIAGMVVTLFLVVFLGSILVVQKISNKLAIRRVKKLARAFESGDNHAIVGLWESVSSFFSALESYVNQAFDGKIKQANELLQQYQKITNKIQLLIKKTADQSQAFGLEHYRIDAMAHQGNVEQAISDLTTKKNEVMKAIVCLKQRFSSLGLSSEIINVVEECRGLKLTTRNVLSGITCDGELMRLTLADLLQEVDVIATHSSAEITALNEAKLNLGILTKVSP